jgi:hypothetical protein
MGSAPTDFVFKAYKTEADAIGDNNALQVANNTAFVTNKEQAAGYNFFTHEKYYFRIISNDPVMEFYIDWDDGEDNDPKGNANYTSIKFESPQFIGITSHIFTRDKVHYPKIRCKSVDGFWSKYYQAFGDDNFSGIDTLIGITTLNSSNDNYKIISNVTSGTSPVAESIPVFGPTPKPPVAVLKADRKRVYAGITNKYLSGLPGEYNGRKVRLSGATSQIEAARTDVIVRVTYTTIGEDGDTASTTRGDIVVADMSFGGVANLQGGGAYIINILKIELVNLLEDTVDADTGGASTTKLYPGEKIMLTVGNDSTGAFETKNTTPQIIGEVSLGNPIVELGDSRSTVTLDATESFARCPETTIDEYRIWDGDFLINYGFAESEPFLAASSTNISDIFADGSGVDTLRTYSGVKTTSYAFHPTAEFTDEDHRWLPKQMLAMTQVKASESAVKAATGTTNDSLATYQYSFLEHWVHEGESNNYGEDRTGIATYGWPSDMSSSAGFWFKSAEGDGWKDLLTRNRSPGMADASYTYSLFSATDVDSSANNDYSMVDPTRSTALDIDGAPHTAVMCVRDSKWTKQWWGSGGAPINTTTKSWPRAGIVKPGTVSANGDWATGYGHMEIRVEAFYTARDGDSYAWKPLKMINKTKHPDYDNTTWYTSGAMEWEEPEDWVSLDPGSIPDRYWPEGDFEGDANAFSRDVDEGDVNYFDVNNRWNATNPKYGIMFLIETTGAATSTTAASWGYHSVWNSFPCSNQHSMLIDVIDPMCVSLNNRAISQSVSFTHKGKYQIIEDRMGKADIRKIGASGGSIKFGGVDLIDTEYTRDKFYDYMRKATPVYMDVTHKSGNISRFFGVITNMSEDHPTSNQIPKFGLSMQVSHMIYMNSSGVIQSDGYVSLGGDNIDEFKYI